MQDLKAKIEAALKGKDVKYSKSDTKVKEKDETYKDMYREVFEQEKYPEDCDDESEEYESKEHNVDKNHSVEIIKTMLTQKLKDKVSQLKGK